MFQLLSSPVNYPYSIEDMNERTTLIFIIGLLVNPITHCCTVEQIKMELKRPTLNLADNLQPTSDKQWMCCFFS